LEEDPKPDCKLTPQEEHAKCWGWNERPFTVMTLPSVILPPQPLHDGAAAVLHCEHVNWEPAAKKDPAIGLRHWEQQKQAG